MRTLNRPMFNMGGPIKQGIMHGIREPYRGGGAALVGNPVYPQTGGREHHNIWKTAIGMGPKVMPHIQKAGNVFKNWFGKTTPVTKSVPKHGPPTGGGNIYSKGYPGGKGIGQGPGSAEVTSHVWTPKGWVERDPIYQIGKKIKEGSGWVGKPIKWAGKTLATPTGALGLMYVGGRWLTSDGTPATDDQIAAHTEGQHGPFDHTDKKKIKKAQAAFAEAQRDTRVKKYLDMMGYDRSKKTAVADALIDASKIVSDRGTLEKKNITRDLINPIIQATSKRFDKPEQIREAVGLMSVKAAIQKDMEDPTIKALRMEQLKELRGGFADDIGDFILAAKGEKVKPAALEGYARSRANKYGLDFTVVTDEQLAQIPEGASEEEIMSTLTSGDGIYKIQESIIQVIDGVPKRIA